MKEKRFITEYANYQKVLINNNKLIREDIKEKALERIDKILYESRRGRITVYETMISLLNILSESN